MTNETIIEPMNEEDIKRFIQECDLAAKLAGFDSREAMDNLKVNASCGMIKFGGSFTHFLGHALAHADSENTAKLLRAFRNECHEHALLYVKWLEKRDKPNE